MYAVAVDKDTLNQDNYLKVSCNNGVWNEKKVYYLCRVGFSIFVSPIMNHNGLFVTHEGVGAYRHYPLNEVNELAEISL